MGYECVGLLHVAPVVTTSHFGGAPKSRAYSAVQARRSRPAQTSARIKPRLAGSLASKDHARVDAGGTARGLPRRDDGHRQNSNRRSRRDRRQGKRLEKVVGQEDTERRETERQPQDETERAETKAVADESADDVPRLGTNRHSDRDLRGALHTSLGAWPAACLALRSQQLAEARVGRQRLQVDVCVQVDSVRRPACKCSAQVVQRVVVLAE